MRVILIETKIHLKFANICFQISYPLYLADKYGYGGESNKAIASSLLLFTLVVRDLCYTITVVKKKIVKDARL